MTLGNEILAELKKHPESSAIAGTYLAECLSRTWDEIVAAVRDLESDSRRPGSGYTIITTNQRDDHRIEPPNEFYVHYSTTP